MLSPPSRVIDEEKAYGWINKTSKKRGLFMQRKSEREFLCDIGEVITVTVTSQGTVHNVAFTKDGQTWNGQPFAFTEPNNEFRSILILGVFSNPNGGNYHIRVEGNPGEFVHEEVMPQDDQFGSVSEDSRGYFFFKKPQ
jgi:hypothetical protein